MVTTHQDDPDSALKILNLPNFPGTLQSDPRSFKIVFITTILLLRIIKSEEAQERVEVVY